MSNKGKVVHSNWSRTPHRRNTRSILHLATTILAPLLTIVACNFGHQQFQTVKNNDALNERCTRYSDVFNDKGQAKVDYAKQVMIRDICEPKYGNLFSLATIEFDDDGTYWDKEQFELTRKEAERIGYAQALSHSRGQGTLLVVYVHGWRHNASDESSNLRQFRHFARDLASSPDICNVRVPEGDSTCPRAHKPHVLAVYLGWRGDSTGGTSPIANRLAPVGHVLRFFQYATFWPRKEAARRVAGIAMTETLLELLSSVDTADITRWKEYGKRHQSQLANFHKSRKVLIGHSFGARALELAIAQAYLGDRSKSLQLFESELGSDGNMTQALAAATREIKNAEHVSSQIETQIATAKREREAAAIELDKNRNRVCDENGTRASDQVKLANISTALANYGRPNIIYQARLSPPCTKYDKLIVKQCADRQTKSDSLSADPHTEQNPRLLAICAMSHLQCLYRSHIFTIDHTLLTHVTEEEKTNVRDRLSCRPEGELSRSLSDAEWHDEDLRSAINTSLQENAADISDWINFSCSLKEKLREYDSVLPDTEDMEYGVREYVDDDDIEGESTSARSRASSFFERLSGALSTWPVRFAPYSWPIDDPTDGPEDNLLVELTNAKEHLTDVVRNGRLELTELDNSVNDARELRKEIDRIDRCEEDRALTGARIERELEDKDQYLEDLQTRKSQEEATLESTKREKERLLGDVRYQIDDYLRPPADLVLLINPASEALIAHDLEGAMHGPSVAKQMDLESDDIPPSIVYITSKGDLATKLLFPAGVWLGRTFRLANTERDRKQRKLTTRTVGHQPSLLTHEAMKYEDDPADEKDLPSPLFTIGNVQYRISAVTRSASHKDEVVARAPHNWVVAVPKEVIQNHGDIFVRTKRGLNVDASAEPPKPLLNILVGLIDHNRLFEPRCPPTKTECAK